MDAAVTRASEVYGTFALVIGLLSWFWLFSHLLLLSAEVNVVLRRRLWPRSLTGELEAADRSALQRAAEAVRQDERQEILVRFTTTTSRARPEWWCDLPRRTLDGPIAARPARRRIRPSTQPPRRGQGTVDRSVEWDS